MRIIQLDTESFNYEPMEPESPVYEKAEKKRVDVRNALVLLVAIEKGDNEDTAVNAVKEAVEFASKQKIKNLILYPFAHLSDRLESPKRAMELFDIMAKEAGKSKLLVNKAPFGWNKKFGFEIKGHPLAEMYRSYGVSSEHGKEILEKSKEKESGKERKGEKGEEKGKKEEMQESGSLKEEEKVVSKWYILDPVHGLVDADKFNFKGYDNLKKLADYEIKKVRSYAEAPPHIALMKKLQLIDYEPGSDAGNMRHYPNGRLIKSLLERYVTSRVIDYGAVEVETPIMYDYEHPALKDYLERFPARHYIVKSEDKEYFLRFAACFGQFLMMHDATISYRNLPLKVYELARYAFRREKSGELAGIKRMRAFTMPDMHTMCADLKQAEEEFDKQFRFCQSVLAEIGIGEKDYEAAFRCTEQFWKENTDFVMRLVKDYLRRPALIEMWSFRYAYFDPKFEFNVIDASGKAAALSTVQIDHENGSRYDIKYTDKEGLKKTPVLLHCSPSGAIERVVHAFLELDAIKQKKGEIQSLPLWLSPTQVRVLPLSEKYLSKCLSVAEELKALGIRADVDDSDDTLGKKISSAEKEWIPYVAVIGEKEIASGELAVRIREGKRQQNMPQSVLVDEINKKLGNMPRAPLTVPMQLSKRPIFFG